MVYVKTPYLAHLELECINILFWIIYTLQSEVPQQLHNMQQLIFEEQLEAIVTKKALRGKRIIYFSYFAN